MAVYIIKFEKPIGNTKKTHGTAQFYIGSCEDSRIQERFEEHKRGVGAKITKAASLDYGYSMAIIAILPGGRKEERQLKNQKNTPRLVKQLGKAGQLLEQPMF